MGAGSAQRERTGRRPSAASYEYRVMTIGKDVPRGDARRILTEQAEYGRWELARSLVYAGGSRKVWLRRKVIRVQSTL